MLEDPEGIVSIQFPGETGLARGSGFEPLVGLQKQVVQVIGTVPLIMSCVAVVICYLGGVHIVCAIHALKSGSANTSKASSCLGVLPCGCAW